MDPRKNPFSPGAGTPNGTITGDVCLAIAKQLGRA